ncbi:MAG: oligosaccharide flippase family protein [Solirubrobacteraceae bacterium]
MTEPSPLSPQGTGPVVPVAEDSLSTDSVIARIALKGRTVRQHTARGTIVNASFLVGLNSLGLVKGFVVAGFLTRTDYGIWGILLITLGTLGWLKQVGVGEKFVQQREEDQELAFQRAVSVEVVFTGIFTVVALLAVPVTALVYGRSDLLLPGLALALLAPLSILQTPLWVYYRRMEFVRQRTLQAIDPIVSFSVTVALAVAGTGYWSLVLGALAGSAAAGIVAVRAAPYRFAWRLDRATLRSYTSFSWPLLLASASAIVVAQGSILLGNLHLGVAGVGVIVLASAIATYTDRVDAIVTDTLYPAICAVRDRTDLLLESFVKSNRLALMWGLPFGVGLALFASDLVHLGLGEQWIPAIGLIQVFGLVAAANHIGFNWHAFYRARGETRPIAVVVTLSMFAFVVAVPPLIAADGLRGYGIGMMVMTATALAARAFYLARLFPGFVLARHAARAVLPTVPAVLVVLAVREIERVDRTIPVALGELALYGAVTLAATLIFERTLLREVLGYLRGRGAASTAAAP